MRLGLSFLATLLLACAASVTAAQETEVPRIVTQDGRHALLVDGEPFLMLGAQMNNSSAWPAMMPKVWPVMDTLGVNTLEVPIAWEQIEPREGEFDFSYLDLLLAQARERNVRLVLLWFATWKNTNPQYSPAWVKLDNGRFPRMLAPDGTLHYALSPHGERTLEADARAFTAFIDHLRQVDPQNTVLMVQIQNEAGSYNLARDHSAEANRLFAGPVPDALVQRLGKQPGTWSDLFGRDAELFFHSWHVASYIDRIAAAGKAVKPIPMYVNAALPGSPFKWQDPNTYASGGPANTVIDVWKAAGPNIDLLAPDIYTTDPALYQGFLDAYNRADNPLMIPETGRTRDYARFFFAAVGDGAIGWAPFGLDHSRFRTSRPVTPLMDAEALAPFAANYALFRPIARLWARLAFEGKTWGFVEPTDPAANHAQAKQIGRYQVTASFGRGDFGNAPPTGNEYPSGGAAIGQIGPDEFLVTDFNTRIDFAMANPEEANLIFERVEQGHYDDAGNWVFERVVNGDQVDWGLNFSTAAQLLRVKIATYPKR
ncbi:DUF5597 domain-containing protein (plasmid) [Croceibacterium sp. TMG7-5b_MA50]|uniref:DUF5597 domain-containing protein n=1 Tax=Croceibacterium sp. TMG7-5b_MA50 TaxID=3121290 RepID=UPI003221631F